MHTVFENIIERLENASFWTDSSFDEDGYCNDDSEEAVYLHEAIEIVNQEAEKYEECYKDCGDCEAYNKEKHHCPKFCKVIKETVKEIEENHNGWILCSERLPNQDGEFTDVLITCESIADGVFVQSAEFYIATDGEPVFDALYHYERVLAWEPLPQPYQPKGE